MQLIPALFALALLALLPARAGAEPAVDAEALGAAVDEVLADSIEQYKWFHANPELSDQEEKTAAHLAKELRELGLTVHEGIGGHGIVGVLKNGRSPKKRVILYRADMDGLPVKEETGVPYASKNEGVMHACGHDVHMATAVGTLAALVELKDRWSGTVLFVGQPAEEIGKGARAMLADPRFKKILRQVGKPSAAFGLHDAADMPAGQVSLLAGYANANVDSVDVTVHGTGGHGARPHQAVDPIVIGAEIVSSLQTIVSRRVAAGTPAVITVGKFAAGTKHNIIPDQATLLLTVRSYSDEVRALLLEQIERVAINVARAHRAPRRPTVKVRDEFTPAAYNDPTWTRELEGLFSELLGKDSVKTHEPSLGGEDFGRYARTLEIPGVMYKLGAVSPRDYRRAKKGGKKLPGLHSAKYAPDYRPTLKTGVTTMTAALLHALAGDPN